MIGTYSNEMGPAPRRSLDERQHNPIASGLNLPTHLPRQQNTNDIGPDGIPGLPEVGGDDIFGIPEIGF